MIQLHSEVGTQWTVIAKTLRGRTENATKNHWNTTVRSKVMAKSSLADKGLLYRSMTPLLSCYVITRRVIIHTG